MKLTERSSLREVAACVAEALARAGLRAVLSGGGCASIYTTGMYQSVDLDFILEGLAPPKQLDAAMAEAGFERKGNQYFHPLARFYVEFPPGPLGIGSDYDIEPIELSIGGARLLSLSATDSCRDRLAAYFHWNDQLGLKTAVQIAARNDIDLDKIRDWSERERSGARFERFVEELQSYRLRQQKRKSARRPRSD